MVGSIWTYVLHLLQVVHFNSPSKYHVYYGSAQKDVISDYFKNFYFMFVQYDGNLLRHKYMSRSCTEPERTNSSIVIVKPTIVCFSELI